MDGRYITVYKNVTTKVQVRNTFTEEMSCITRIRQGDSFNPILFGLVMDKLVSSVNILQDG